MSAHESVTPGGGSTESGPAMTSRTEPPSRSSPKDRPSQRASRSGSVQADHRSRTSVV